MFLTEMFRNKTFRLQIKTEGLQHVGAAGAEMSDSFWANKDNYRKV